MFKGFTGLYGNKITTINSIDIYWRHYVCNT